MIAPVAECHFSCTVTVSAVVVVKLCLVIFGLTGAGLSFVQDVLANGAFVFWCCCTGVREVRTATESCTDRACLFGYLLVSHSEAAGMRPERSSATQSRSASSAVICSLITSASFALSAESQNPA